MWSDVCKNFFSLYAIVRSGVALVVGVHSSSASHHQWIALRHVANLSYFVTLAKKELLLPGTIGVMIALFHKAGLLLVTPRLQTVLAGELAG